MMKSKIFCLLAWLSAAFADFGVQTGAELHWKYQNLISDLEDYTLYARLEKFVQLPKEWQMFLRLDIPYIWLWGSQDEVVQLDADGIVFLEPTTVVMPMGVNEHGLSDILTRAFFVTPPLGQATIGFGSEVNFPTAQREDLGTGKYAARPMVGFRYDFPTLGKGAWLAFLAKYQFSFAGDPNRPSYRIFFMQPVFVYPFGNQWALSSSPEIQYNCKTFQWFVPFSISLAKTVDRFTLAAQYQRGLVTQFPVFQDEVEITFRCAF